MGSRTFDIFLIRPIADFAHRLTSNVRDQVLRFLASNRFNDRVYEKINNSLSFVWSIKIKREGDKELCSAGKQIIMPGYQARKFKQTWYTTAMGSFYLNGGRENTRFEFFLLDNIFDWDGGFCTRYL